MIGLLVLTFSKTTSSLFEGKGSPIMNNFRVTVVSKTRKNFLGKEGASNGAATSVFYLCATFVVFSCRKEPIFD